MVGVSIDFTWRLSYVVVVGFVSETVVVDIVGVTGFSLKALSTLGLVKYQVIITAKINATTRASAR